MLTHAIVGAVEGMAASSLDGVLRMVSFMMQVKSPKAFNSRIYTLIKDAMDLKGDLTVSPQDDSIEVMLLCHLGCCLECGCELMGLCFVTVALHAVWS